MAIRKGITNDSYAFILKSYEIEIVAGDSWLYGYTQYNVAGAKYGRYPGKARSAIVLMNILPCLGVSCFVFAANSTT